MNAVISGRAAVALLIDGAQVHSIHYDGPDEQVARTVDEWNLLLGGVDDLEFFEDCDEAAVRDRLEDAVDTTEALDLVLYLFDRSLSDDVRRTASLELDELLAYPEIESYLESILYARPLAESADQEGGRRCCDPAANHTRRVIDALIDRQQAVRLVRHAFESACQEIPDQADRDRSESACLHAGIFARFAKAGDDSNTIGSVWISALQDPILKERLSVDLLRNTLTLWARILREMWGQGQPQSQKEQTSRTRSHHEQQENRGRGKQKGRKSFDRERAKVNVDSQKERAVELLKRRKFAQARRVIDEVVQYSLGHGGAEYACMTLCSLAKVAQDLGLGSIQLELTQRSIELDSGDGWSWSQHGKALLEAGRPTDALHAYDRALALIENAHVKTGRAEVLKALGRLQEALLAYEQVIQEHPENVVAKTGRAEVLRALGRLPEALSAYEQVIQKYQEDVVSKNGRAEVLKALGRLPEALSAYERVIQEHPEDVFAKTGRAEVLKALGRLPETLSAYEQVIQDFPADVVAKTGRAEVLKTLGRLPEALSAYEQVIRDFPADVVAKNARACVLVEMGQWDEALTGLPTLSERHNQNWIGLHIRGMILLKKGQLTAAREIFEVGIAECPFAASLDYFRAGLCLVEMAERRYAAAAETLAQVRDPALQRPATLLRVHALGADEKYSDAVQVYQTAPESASTLEQQIKEELTVRYVERTGPQHNDAWLLEQEVRLLLAALAVVGIGRYLSARTFGGRV